MSSLVVCADPGSWEQAGRFAAKELRDAELRTFENVRRRATARPILVYLRHPDYDRLRALLRMLEPGAPDVVIYYAGRLSAQGAAQLGKLVGETRPQHTSVFFGAKAAAASVLRHARTSDRKNGGAPPANSVRRVRKVLGLTQTEMAGTIGVSLRTVQNWERAGVMRRPRQFRDLDELMAILTESIGALDIPAWLRSRSDAFGGARPIELLKEGKARDIIVEFRRLQAGEPA